MTGNVVFAGFAIVGAPGFSLSASLFALAGFLVGAGFGGTMITRVGSDRAALLRAGTAAEVALAAVALVLAALSGDPGVSHGTTHIIAGAFGPAITDALAAVLATAMGIQNAVAVPFPAGGDRRGCHGRGRPPGPVAHPATAAQVAAPRAPLRFLLYQCDEIAVPASTASCCYHPDRIIVRDWPRIPARYPARSSATGANTPAPSRFLLLSDARGRCLSGAVT